MKPWRLPGDRGRYRTGTLALLSMLLAGSPDATATEDPLELLRAMRARYAPVRDYTALYVMQERAGGSLSERQDVELSFARPFKIAMRWVAGPGRGRVALYVAGENEGKLIAREGGWLGFKTWWLDPSGSFAMRGHRRPITETGIGFAIDRVLEVAESVRQSRPNAILDLGAGSVDGRPTRTIELRLPPDALSTARILISIDTDLGLPIREEEFDEKDLVLESTTYTQLRLNVGLDAASFDPANPALGLR